MIIIIIMCINPDFRFGIRTVSTRNGCFFQLSIQLATRPAGWMDKKREETSRQYTMRPIHTCSELHSSVISSKRPLEKEVA